MYPLRCIHLREIYEKSFYKNSCNKLHKFKLLFDVLYILNLTYLTNSYILYINYYLLLSKHHCSNKYNSHVNINDLLNLEH